MTHSRGFLNSEPTASAARSRQDDAPRVLYWHFGRSGAGTKFTMELVRGTVETGAARPFVAAVTDCELARRAHEEFPDTPLCEIRTFRGEKETLAGKLAAAGALTRLPRIARDVARFVRHHRIDMAICTMYSIWDLPVVHALARQNVPFLLIAHDVHPHPGDSYPLRRLSMHRQIRAADAVVALSAHVRDQVRHLRGRADERIEVIPHGAFEFGAGRLRAAPVARPPRLLFFGRILAYKGLGVLLDACRLLQARGAPVELEIMGSGDLRPYASKLAGLAGLHVTNRWIDDAEIGDALAATDIVVLPYIEASQSGVAASAATAGVPCVATPVGGLAEQVFDGRTGVVARGITPDALAEAIQRLVEDPALYRRCSSGALAYAREELAWGAIAARVVEVAQRTARTGSSAR